MQIHQRAAGRGFARSARLAVAQPLHRTSLMLMINTGVQAGLGFAFWTIAAHRVDPSVIGVVTAIISLNLLFGTLGTLGLPNALIRYLAGDPSRSRRTFGEALLASQAATGLVLAIAWLTPLRPTAHSAADTGAASFLLIALVQISSLSMIIDASLMAHRRPGAIVIKNTFAGALRTVLVMLPAFLADEVHWLLAIQVAAAGVACFVALAILMRTPGTRGASLRPSPFLNASALRYTIGNYAGMASGILPLSVTPAIVLSLGSSTEAAYFGVALMILGLLNVVASSVAQSLFAEAHQRNSSTRDLVRQAIRSIACLLVPAVGIAVIVAPWVLGLFGPDYQASASTMLRWMCLGCLPAAACYLADAAVNAVGDGTGYLLLNVSNSALVLVLVWWGAPHGLNTVGLLWCVSQLVSAVIACSYARAALRRHNGNTRVPSPQPAAKPSTLVEGRHT